MGLLKRKQEKTTTLGVRVPISVKAEIDALRQTADAEGFDLTGSLTDAVARWIKQVRGELSGRHGLSRDSDLSARKARGAVGNGSGSET